jgi:hypothetical protein
VLFIGNSFTSHNPLHGLIAFDLPLFHMGAQRI